MAFEKDKENLLFMVLYKQEVFQLRGSLTDKNHTKPQKKRRGRYYEKVEENNFFYYFY
ncbi:hypothetical protein [Fictibacillus barbaricus]|uniref:hypothetical protein n=1 Tax=Fictibacillus barbaricus TaxID=182136 RepID=UPI001669DC15|nr:hypothetical protein [Fictibacillus barbaricus]